MPVKLLIYNYIIMEFIVLFYLFIIFILFLFINVRLCFIRCRFLFFVASFSLLRRLAIL